MRICAGNAINSGSIVWEGFTDNAVTWRKPTYVGSADGRSIREGLYLREGVYRAPLAIAAKVRIQIAASKARPQWRT
jgi:hypothetical protein